MAWITGYVVSERFKESGTNKKRRDYILGFPGISDAGRASLLIGREVEYRDGETVVRGRVVDIHGRQGEVRARFRKGLPGKTWRGRIYLKLDERLANALRREFPSA